MTCVACFLAGVVVTVGASFVFALLMVGAEARRRRLQRPTEIRNMRRWP